MHLTLGDKAAVFLSNFRFWVGLVMALPSLAGLLNIIPKTDIGLSEPPYDAQTVALVRATESTNFSEGEDEKPIIAIYYQYKAANQNLYGCSYSDTISAKAGQEVVVQYVTSQPEYSCIIGARTAPHAAISLVVVCTFLIVGSGLLLSSLLHGRSVLAIAADACIVDGTRERALTKAKKYEESTTYRLVYSYLFNGTRYTHTVEADDLDQFKDTEKIFIRCSSPHRAMLVVELPARLRNKLAVLPDQHA